MVQDSGSGWGCVSPVCSFGFSVGLCAVCSSFPGVSPCWRCCSAGSGSVLAPGCPPCLASSALCSVCCLGCPPAPRGRRDLSLPMSQPRDSPVLMEMCWSPPGRVFVAESKHGLCQGLAGQPRVPGVCWMSGLSFTVLCASLGQCD